MLPFFGRFDIGLDLGTANTQIYVTHSGIAVNEPSLVMIDVHRGEIEAVGSAANVAVGRTPRRLRTKRPIRGGMVTDLRLCDGMLRRFLSRVTRRWAIRRMRIVAAVPGEMTEVERMAITESLKKSGAAEVFLVDQALVAARAAQVNLETPTGRLVVDIGAGITGISLLSFAQTVQTGTVQVAGDDMDRAISEHIRQAHQLEIGERTAERIKIAVGSAQRLPDPLTVHVKGRCLIQAIPREVAIHDEEIRAAILPVVEKIASAIHRVLEEAPPELSSDLLQTGILLTGGSAMLRGLDRYMSDRFGVPVSVDDNPLLSVIAGLANWMNDRRSKK